MSKQFYSTEERAHFAQDIKLLLQPYFSFRLYIVFKQADGRPGPKRHFYGNEHQCTYRQLLANKLPSISMDKQKAYTNLIHLIEVTYKGKYIGAKIYGREEGSDQFNILHRDYLRGVLQSSNDPDFSNGSPVYEINYRVKDGRVIVDASFKD